jgi:hypothetical protein
MKLFLKILLFIFTMIFITAGEIKSSTMVTIFQEETSYSFFQKPQLGDVILENHNANSCLNGENIVTYSEQIAEVERNVAKGGKITTTEELIKFLDAVNETTTIAQLEEKGIKVFFRGTTRDLNGNLFPGNPNTIANGISTSTDPIKSTIFAIESATGSGSKGVLQIALPNELANTKLLAPNRRVNIELEVVFETSAENFSKLSKVEIPIEKARQAIKEIYGVELPTRLGRDEATELLKTINASSLEQSFDFYQKILK